MTRDCGLNVEISTLALRRKRVPIGARIFAFVPVLAMCDAG